MDLESKIQNKCKYCSWGAHPKSGLCSNHDPDLVSRKLIDNLILQVEKNSIVDEILLRQRGIFGDQSFNDTKKKLNRLCLENKVVYYLSKECIYTTILCLKVLPNEILKYIFDYLRGIFLITAEQARMLCPNRYNLRIHKIYPHVGDCFNIQNEYVTMCYYHKYDLCYAKQLMNRKKIDKPFDEVKKSCFRLPEPVEHPVLIAVAVEI